MALHPKADFAKLCGLTTGNLTNYVKRGKVVMSGDYIDDSIPLNQLFIEKRKINVELKEPDVSDSKPAKKLHLMRPDAGIPDAPNVKEPSFDDDEEIDSSDDVDDIIADRKSMTTLTKKKLIVEIQKKEREISLLRLREDKLNAIVIPTELVKVIFSQHSRTLATQFKNSVENILTIIAQKASLSNVQQAELRGKLLGEINEAMAKSVEESKKNIANIQKEFIEKRDVGERS